MKKLIVTTITALMTTAITASAGAPVKADVPFEFHFGKQVLPAGHYQFMAGPTMNTIRVVGSARGKNTGITMIRWAAASVHPPMLKFLVVGDQRVLAEISNGASRTAISTSSWTRKLAKGEAPRYALIPLYSAD